MESTSSMTIISEDRLKVYDTIPKQIKHKTTILNNQGYGFCYLIMSCFFMTCCEMTAKIATNSYSFWFVVLFRNIIQLVIGIVYCRKKEIKINPNRQNNIYLTSKGIINALSSLLFYFSLTLLPFSYIKIIYFINPIITSFLALVVLGEPFKFTDIVISVTCFIGVIFAASPDGIDDLNIRVYKMGTMAVLLSSVLYSVTLIIARKVADRTHYMVHVIYNGLYSSLFALFGLLITRTAVTIKLDVSLITLLLVSLFGTLAQVTFNKGLQFIHAGPSSLIKSMELVFGNIFGLIIFHEHIGLNAVFGTGIIVVCSLGLGLKKIFY